MNDGFEDQEPSVDDIWDWAKENADTILYEVMRDLSPRHDDFFKFIREVYDQEHA